MKKIPCYILLLSALFLAIPVSAQVVISEVAWMGSANGETSGVNANDEWIELYNSGATDVDLSGWFLEATDGTPTIDISLKATSASTVISAGGFFVLERSDDNSIPTVVADVIYTGSLSNSGEKLILKDASGTVVDTVDGSDGWNIEGEVVGNNTTKDTAQRDNNVWVTASPTPGASASGSNSTEETQTPTEDNTDGSTEGDSFKEEIAESYVPNGNQFVWPIKPNFMVSAGPKTRRLLVGADAMFEGHALTLGGEPMADVSYVWVFGDGGNAEGNKMLYHYMFPGKYIAVLKATSAMGDVEVARVNITVINADISVSSVGTGINSFIELSNKTPHELDLSFWHLRVGEKTFTFPEGTAIVAKSKIKFSAEKTKLYAGFNDLVSLLYPNGLVEYSYNPFAQETTPPPLASRTVSPTPITPTYESAPALIQETPGSVEDTTAISTTTPETRMANILFTAPVNESRGTLRWLFAVSAIVSISVIALHLRRKDQTVADTFTISEE